MRRHPILFVIVGILVLLAGYLFFWPVAIDPALWTPPAAPERTGIYAQNDLLASVLRLESGTGSPLEGVAIDREGRLYAGTKNGAIIRYDREGKNPELFVKIGGWPLGIAFDSFENLIVCNGKNGLLAVSPEKSIQTLATEQGGIPFRNVDGLDIAPDGMIYFTDVSKKFTDDHYMDELLEHRPNGRLLAYDPVVRKTRLVMDGLYFPNGIAVSPDNQFLLLAEMGRYRILRIPLTGSGFGTFEVFIDNLPGFPDGLFTGDNGIFWVTLVSPRDKLADTVLFPNPCLRKVLRRLPRALMPAPKNYGFILGLDSSGKVVYNLQDPTGVFGQITNVLEHNGKLYMGSLSEDAIGVIPVPRRPMN